ncbi:MAG: hypothetical protein ABSG91_10745 [Syntrophobacteraceae bacterium]|jgi:hypothetical protein
MIILNATPHKTFKGATEIDFQRFAKELRRQIAIISKGATTPSAEYKSLMAMPLRNAIVHSGGAEGAENNRIRPPGSLSGDPIGRLSRSVEIQGSTNLDIFNYHRPQECLLCTLR